MSSPPPAALAAAGQLALLALSAVATTVALSSGPWAVLHLLNEWTTLLLCALWATPAARVTELYQYLYDDYMAGGTTSVVLGVSACIVVAVFVLDKAGCIRKLRDMGVLSGGKKNQQKQASPQKPQNQENNSLQDAPISNKNLEKVASAIASPSADTDTDEDFAARRRPRKAIHNIGDSDSQVADDEDELTGTDVTPVTSPSPVKRVVALKAEATTTEASSNGSGYDTNGSLSSPSASSSLSRRQKKNRKHGDGGGGGGGKANGGDQPQPAGVGGDQPNASINNNVGSPINGKHGKKKGGSSQIYQSLGLTDEQIYEALERYILSEAARTSYGFPIESSLMPGRAYVMHNPACNGYNNPHEDVDDADPDQQPGAGGGAAAAGEQSLNPNAREFHPRSQPQTPKLAKKTLATELAETANESGGEDQLKEHQKKGASSTMSTSMSASLLSPTAEEFVPKSHLQQSGGDADTSRPLKKVPSVVINSADRMSSSMGPSEEVAAKTVKKVASESSLARAKSENEVKRCLRCSRPFRVRDGVYIDPEKCNYHWGKLRWNKSTKLQIYECCCKQKKTKGCEEAALHVWKGIDSSDGPQYLESYVATKVPKPPQQPQLPQSPGYPNAFYPPSTPPFPGVFAMDAEMAFTAYGLEPVRLTVVGLDGKLKYEAYVRPDHEIVDYNTRYSGLCRRDHERLANKSLREVQSDLMGFLSARSMLVGHGLENDLRVLRLVHPTVIDTSVVFMEDNGLRPSLKSLALVRLGKEIQTSERGHDSGEDAVTSMQLMLLKVGEDLREGGIVSR